MTDTEYSDWESVPVPLAPPSSARRTQEIVDRRLQWTSVATLVGRLTLVGGPAGLRNVWFEDETLPRLPEADREDTPFVEPIRQLTAYFDGDRSGFDLTLDLQGTEFQRRVWQALREIPLGTTRTYGSISNELTAEREKVTSARAVAAAVGRTPVPIIVPCHRVVGADGSLTGYRGGLARKQALLELEGAAIVKHGAREPLAKASVSAGQLPLL